jgi:hypothetical protein
VEVEVEVEVEDGRRCAPLNESEVEVENEVEVGRAAKRLETLNSQLKTGNCKLQTATWRRSRPGYA